MRMKQRSKLAPRKPKRPAALARRGEPELLRSFGERIRQTRTRRGMTRKLLAKQSGVSERYLAQVETGTGNMSLLVLHQIARALGVSLDSLLLEGPEPPVEFTHTVEFLRRLSADELRAARQLLFQQFGGVDPAMRHSRIALVGLRGAGKSTLGAALAERLEMPFLELDRLIEEASGLRLDLIFEFHGQSGFRRLELECLNDVLRRHPRFVLATGGSLVSESRTFERLLSSCFTAWVRASPEEHMERVIGQGDIRPMAHNRNAMADLERILAEREVLYSKADVQIDTSGQTLEESLDTLVQALRDAPVRLAESPVAS
jgi:XRE family aerobic/anaerobic benzoate catabolism transcriptional regulator